MSMTDEADLAALRARLRTTKWAERDDALKEAVALGKQAEALLVDSVQDADWLATLMTAAALGDLRGPGPGDEVLRRLLKRTGPHTRDIRCAAVLALAKRLGPGATADFVAALQIPDGGVKTYALLCLAGVGDGRAWDDVFGWLRNRLRRVESTRYGHHSPTVAAVDYLLRHSKEQADDRAKRLAKVLRENKIHLSERDEQWLLTAWPTLQADDEIPDLPSPDCLIVWSRDPLFAARAIALVGVPVCNPAMPKLKF
jgi:hypothetical protein